MSYKFDLIGNGEVNPDLSTLTIGGISSIAYASPNFKLEMFTESGEQLCFVDMKKLKNQNVYVMYLRPGNLPIDWGNNPSNDIRDCMVIAELPDGSRRPIMKRSAAKSSDSRAVSVAPYRN